MSIWMPYAWMELGQKEIAGDADNPRIIEYHSATTLKATDDEVPWCSSFVNWCMRKAGLVGTGSAAARSWLTWGVDGVLEYGEVAVISRGSNPEQGHVAFLLDMNKDWVWLLGGNQHDSVSVSRFPRASLLDCRRSPATGDRT